MEDVNFLRCTRGFLLPGGRMIRAGALVTVDDPMFKDGRESLLAHFEPVTREVVEQATRAPGEVRITPPRQRRRKAKTED